MPPNVMRRVWKDDGTNFERLMGHIRDIRISSVHVRRNRYKFTPPADEVIVNHPEGEYPDEIEEYQENGYN